MYFESQTFEFIGDKNLNIYVAIEQKDGSIKEEAFRYKRKKMPSLRIFGFKNRRFYLFQ